MATPTRSSRRRSKNSEAVASDLSPEVQWYLESRGYELPDDAAYPLWRTPEPRNVKGAQFDPARVDKVLKALSALRHTKGKWAGRPLKLAPVQIAHIVAPIFGWVAPDDDGDYYRIIREAYVEMPRKGAKTTTVSGLSMYLAFADGEAGAEVLMGAASKDQAGQAFKPIAALAKSSPVLQQAGVKATRNEIVQDSTSSVCKVVSSRGDLAHGANVHGGLVDELHVHKSGDLLEAIESGAGARTQPLVFIITTADDGQVTSVYAQRRELIEKLCKRTLKAPHMYGVVFAAEETDDPFAEETWKKANPLYPETPSRAFMRAAADKAKANPVAMDSFLRLHLGIRAKQGKQFINIPKWDRNGSLLVPERLKGREAWGGLDLGSVSDLTALVWLFPDLKAGGYDVLARFWTPEESLPALDASTSRNASSWVREGWLTVTPGDVTDYDFIEKQVLKDLGTYDVAGIGYDRWNSSQLVLNLLEEDAPMVKVGQGVASLSAPTKEMDRLIRAGTHEKPLLRHGGNPVLRWMAGNFRVYTDPAGNIKPDKAKSMDKIDGITALVTGLSLAMPGEQYDERDYETEGLMSV